MKRWIPIMVALILLFTVVGCQEHSSIPVADSAKETIAQLSMKDKLSDFESLYKILDENYPFFEVNKRLNGVDWIENKDKYINMVNMAVTEQQYKNALDAILRDLNNGHTNIIDKEFYHFAKEAYGEHKGESAPWLEQINKPKSILRYADKDYSEKKQQGIVNQVSEYIKPNNVSTRIILEDKVAYLGIATLNSFNIESDMKVIRPFLERVKNYNALIIDIRGNGGGDSDYWSRELVPMLIDKPIVWKTYYAYRGGAYSDSFVKARLRNSELKPIMEIAKENLLNTPPELLNDFKYFKKFEMTIQPQNSLGVKGKIYLLVDRHVYSSAEMFASFAKNTGFATLVGNTTGGDGIGQDPLFYSLPHSGYILRFPSVMGLTHDGSCNEEHKTVPDIRVNTDINQDKSQDTAIQYVLNLYK